MMSYQEVVSHLRAITGMVWASTDRCCLKVDEFGAPECCYQIVSGIDEPTFTVREVMILQARYVDAAWFAPFPAPGPDDLYVLNRAALTPEQIRAAAYDGWLANSLECAGHPTRPILIRRQVVGIVAIDACNTGLALEYYRSRRQMLMELWQEAVDLTGVKPYYVTKSVKDGWHVL